MAFRRFFYTILDWPCSPSKGGAALDSRRSAISSSSVNCFMCGHCVLRSIWIPVASDLSEKPIKFAGLEAPKLSWGLEFPGLSIISTRVQKAGKSKSETCSASLLSSKGNFLGLHTLKMGCDGGSFCYRSEMVRLRKRRTPLPARYTTASSLLASTKMEALEDNSDGLAVDYAKFAKSTRCALSREELREPIVATPEGRLINKEALIRALLKARRTEGSTSEKQLEVFAGVQSLKDVIDLTLHSQPGRNEARTATVVDLATPLFSCPITDKPLNGNFRFTFSPDCGCVHAELALKELAASCTKERESRACLVCGAVARRLFLINAEEREAREQRAWWQSYRPHGRVNKPV